MSRKKTALAKVQSLHLSENRPEETSLVQSIRVTGQIMLTPHEKKELLEDLLVALQNHARSTIAIGKILFQLRAGTPHGEWKPLLKLIQAKMRIARRTVYNYLNNGR